MPNPPLDLDDIFASDTTGRRPRQSVPDTAAVSLDDILAGAPAPAGPGRGSSPAVTPSPTPGSRRGITDAAGDLWHRLFPQETRRPAEPIDRRTGEQQAASARREGQGLLAGAVRPEATATPSDTYTRTRTGAVVTDAVADVNATRRARQVQAAAQENFSPEHWLDVARRGMELGSTLHAQGKHEEAEDVLRKAYNAQLLGQNSKEADTAGAIALDNLFFGQAYPGQRRNIAEIAQPGMTFSPEEQRDLGVNGASATRGFDATKDLAAPLAGQLPAMVAGGVIGRAGAGIVGSALEGVGEAAQMGGGLARSGLIRGAGTVTRGIGEALGRLAEPIEATPMVGPAAPFSRAGAGVPTMAFDEAPALYRTRIAEEVAEFRRNLPAVLGRGATEGQIIGGAQQYEMARAQGATPEQAATAAIEGLGFSVPIGALAELGLGVAGRAAGVGYDPIGRATSRIGDYLRPDRPTIMPTDLRQSIPLERRMTGQEAGPFPPRREDVLGRLGAGLEDFYGNRRAARQGELEDVFAGQQDPARPAGPEWWQEQVGEPQQQGPRQRANPGDLRSARELATGEPDLQPIEPQPVEEANAFHRMQRAQRDAEALTASREAEANDPNLRLELAAQARPSEKQGPLTLSQTIAQAGRDAEAEEPLAVDYREAINKYVDALATVRDAGENGPNTRQQVTLARARRALNAAREKYGKQIGASAVLALAAQDDDLTDDEKKMVGLGGLAIGSTLAVHALPKDVIASAVGRVDEFLAMHPPGSEAHGTRYDVQAWVSHIFNGDVDTQHHQAITRKLRDAAVSSRGMTAEEVRAALEGEPKPLPNEALHSRLRKHIEDRQTYGKKWDEPRPAADWIAKLKGSNAFSKKELGLILPDLEDAQAKKVKLGRDDVLLMAEDKLPRIERVTLAHEGDDTPGGERSFHENIMPIEAVEAQHGRNDRVLADQVRLRDDEIEAITRTIERHTQQRREDVDFQRQYAMTSLAKMETKLRGLGLDDATVGEVQRAVERAVEEERSGQAYAMTNSLARDIADRLVEPKLSRETPTVEAILQEHGFTVEEQPKLRYTFGGENERGTFTDEYVWDADDPDRPKTLDDAKILIARDYSDDVVPTLRLQEPERYNYYVVRDANGNARGAGKDLVWAQESAARRAGIMRPPREGQLNDATRVIGDYLGNHRDLLREQENYASLTADPDEALSYNWTRSRADLAREIMTLNALREEERLRAANEDPAPPVGGEGEPIKPPVTGRPIFHTYQRIGGGTDYRELLNVHENHEGSPYVKGHYGSDTSWGGEYDNVASHARVENHQVYRTPGVDGPEVEVLDTDSPEVSHFKTQIREVRRRRARALEVAGEAANEFETLPPEQTRRGNFSDRAEQLFETYQKYARQAEDLGRRDEELVRNLREYRGDTSEPETVAVMLESQADWSQDANKYGIQGDWQPGAPEAIQAAEDAWAAANDEYTTLLERSHRLGAEELKARRAVEGLFDDRRTGGFLERYRAAARERNERVLAESQARGDYTTVDFADDMYTPPARTLHDTDTDGAYVREWEVVNAVATPEERAVLDGARAAQRAIEEHGREMTRVSNVRQDLYNRLETLQYDPNADKRVPAGLFTESGLGTMLNVARFLLDAAERGIGRIAWSDAANRVLHAHLKPKAAKLVYDQEIQSAVRRLLSGLGFKKVEIDKLYINGAGHWHMELTPEMRRAIRRAGLPILGLLALVGSPDEAEAQDPTKGREAGSKMYGTMVGGAVAGAAIAYLATRRKVRRLIKENARLESALMMDDLSGLANKNAFARARESVDRDPAFHWVVFDGDRFKKLNDEHGHAEGDKAIQHFGRIVRDAAAEMDIPMRGFRFGGDEIAFAAPAEKAAEFLGRVEAGSHYTQGDVTTKLTGGMGTTFEAADAMLRATKSANREADPSLRRPLDLHANPLPQAIRELARYPSAAALAGVGALIADQSDDDKIKATGAAMIPLAVLSAIGSRRIAAGKDFLADRLLEHLQKSKEGTAVARFFNPDAMLSPEVKDAVLRYEADRARATARAAEMAQRGQALGPQGDRAVSDVIEGEDWEDTRTMAPKDLKAVLTFASALDAEYQKAAGELLATGARTPDELLPNYAGPRRYAYYEAQAAQLEGGPGTNVGQAPRIKVSKHRTLDEPVRRAEAALQEAQASGDPVAVQDAQDALDQEKAVQFSRRLELGEIRESSYRSAQGIERAYADAAAARLFTTLRNTPGVVHPEWEAAIGDLQTAKAMRKAAVSQADRDAAQQLADQATVALNTVTRKYQRAGGDYVALPDTRGMGMLRGAVVQRDVANTLVGFSQKGLYAKLLRRWKEVKTVFNPGTHQGNILSNIAFAHMEGLHLWEQPTYLKRAAQDLRKYGDAARALTEAGVLDASATLGEQTGVAARDMRRTEGLEGLLATTRPETADVLRREGITEQSIRDKARKAAARGAIGGAALGAAKLYDSDNPEDAVLGAGVGAALGGFIAGKRAARVRAAYLGEDNLFRAALWLKLRKGGMTADEATSYTREAFGNFRSRSPALQMARSTIAPFILYPAKALPRFGAQVVDHPWRYMTLVALWGGLNAYSESQVGEVPESDIRLQDRRRGGYILPGFTQLPFANARGEKAGVDVSRWTPMSAVTTAAPPGSVPAAFDERLPDIFRAGGPVVDLAARFGANVDPYSGKPAYARDYPARENVASLLNDVSGTMLPSFLDFHADRIKDDLENQDYDKLKNDALGPTGLRPRFIRPGANMRDAAFQLENSLREMTQQFKRDVINNKNPTRVTTLRARHLQRVQQALTNFRERTGSEPPPEMVRAALAEEPNR